MSGGVELGQNRLHEFLVARVGRADKIVNGQFQFLRERFPIRRQLVAVNLRTFALGDRGLLHFLAVFIEAGQKKNFLSQTAARPRNHVGHDLLVRMAEMRLAVHVINRRCDVKPFAHC